jgi:hypothetical protein
MSRLLVAALAMAAGASAAPSLVLAPGLSGDARRATYESVTQTDVLAGVLRAAGVASAAAGAEAQQWEADLQVASAQRPRLVAVLLTEAHGSKQARAVSFVRLHRAHRPALTGALCPLVLCHQELRDAVAASPASLALVNAEQEEAAVLGGAVADAVAAARAAGGDVSPLLVSGSCQEVRPGGPRLCLLRGTPPGTRFSRACVASAAVAAALRPWRTGCAGALGA